MYAASIAAVGRERHACGRRARRATCPRRAGSPGVLPPTSAARRLSARRASGTSRRAAPAPSGRTHRRCRAPRRESGAPGGRAGASRTAGLRAAPGSTRESSARRSTREVDDQARGIPSGPARSRAGEIVSRRDVRGAPQRRRRAADAGMPASSPITLEPCFSCTSSSRVFGGGVVDDRRAAARTRCRRARRRRWRVRARSATTSATGSPTKRTSVSASGGRGVSGLAAPIDVCHCSFTSGLRSAAVNTNRTPGAASAAEVSIPRIAARGY